MGLRFGVVIVADLALTLLTKLWFYASGGNTYLNVLSPSGHASFSVTVYGCCAVVLASKRRFAEQTLILCAAAVGVLIIIVSRIVLHTHTPEEVILGSLVGGTCVAVFSVGGSPLQKLRLRLPIWLVIVLMVGTVSAWAVGRRVHTESFIEHWGAKIGSVWDNS